MSTEVDAKPRVATGDMEALRNGLFMAGRRDLEKVDRGALPKAGQRRRRRGISAGNAGTLFWVKRIRVWGRAFGREGYCGHHVSPILDHSAGDVE